MQKQPHIEQPTPEKIRAWAKVHEIWKQDKSVTQRLLDAEFDAANTD